MANTLTITKSYTDGDVLLEADLDNIRNDVETFLNTTKLNDDNIKTGGIGTTSIADDAVTTVKILDANITTAKIADANVTTVKVLDSNITTAKIADANVTTAKIADNNVTRAKLEAVGVQNSNSSGSFSTTSTSFVDITNLSVTITTSGRPVIIGLKSFDTNESRVVCNGSTSPSGTIQLLQDSTTIGTYRYGSDATEVLQPANIYHIDEPTAGTYTYKFQAKISTGGTTFSVLNYKMFAYEL
ncbi:MAG: hypothetical protein GTN36_05505 [Candidatus Aenigmarchaeota archaeon]|nr:hypothetical protein [Candidatus Aenigmarchaeota archaeon]